MLKYIRTSDYQAGPIGETSECQGWNPKPYTLTLTTLQGECQGKVAANSDQTALASYLRANADIDAQATDPNPNLITPPSSPGYLTLYRTPPAMATPPCITPHHQGELTLLLCLSLLELILIGNIHPSQTSPINCC